MFKYKLRRSIFNIYAHVYYLVHKIMGKKVNYDQCQISFFKFWEFFTKDFYYKIGDDKVFYNPIRSGVGWVAFFNKSFEQEELDQCKKLIKTDDVVFDIGANIGSHSLLFSSLANKGIVYSVEPSRITFANLLRNVKYKDNIVPLSVAVSNTNALLNFYECDNDVMSGLKNTDRSGVTFVNKVPAVKLDDLCKMLSIQKLDFVKIDVEGLETEVIEGFTETLSKFKPIIFCEIYSGTNSNPDPDKTIQLINSLGYQANILKGSELVPFEKHDDNYHNYFFISK